MWPFSRSTRMPPARAPKRRRAPVRLVLELLEDRRVPSTIPNDPRLAELWGLDKIGAPAAWDLTTGSTRVVVAVNDSGVDYTHPDLYKNIWINQAEIPSTIRPRLQDVDHDGLITFWDLNDASGINIGPGKITDLNGTGFIDGGDLLYPVASGGWANGSDDGPNGYPDDLIGWDFFGGDNDPMDEVGHGTKVAGIIGATANNGAGIAGVNWQVEIMPLVRTPRSSVEALLYAVNNGARISNHSYGILASEVTLAERATITAVGRYAAAKGHLAVAAANNQASDIDAVPIFPASLDLPNIIAVAATTRDDKLAEFSNYGAASVDLGAPGVDIWSTIPGGGYDEGNGTSFAAPHVAGAAALILARNPGLSYAQVKALILDNVDPLPALQGKTVTGGRLNIFKALSAAEPPARVESVIVNDGAAQRSMVNSLTVTLDHVVTLAPGAFELRRQDGSLVGLNVTASTVGGRTVAVLTFAGSDILGGSLADGSYALTIRGDRIHDAIGRPLDGDGDGLAGGDRADRFFRLFGDSDGDGDVGRLDRDRFRSAFKTSAGEAGYLWYFDFDGDGDVDGRDNGQFNRRFGQH